MTSTSVFQLLSPNRSNNASPGRMRGAGSASTGSSSNHKAKLSPNAVKSSSRSLSFRRTSSSRSFKLEAMERHPCELDLEAFEEFVSRTLPGHVEDEDLLQSVIRGAKDLLSHSEWNDGIPSSSNHSSGSSRNSAAATPKLAPSLQDLELGLMSILEYTPSLPSPVVTQLHSYRGLLFERLQDPVHASECFMRALWIQTHSFRSTTANKRKEYHQHHTAAATTTCAAGVSTSQPFTHSQTSAYFDIATTEHRLGVSLGKAGQYQQAMDQIKRAIASYEKAHRSVSDALVVMAKEDLHDVAEEHQLDLLRKSPRANTIVRPELGGRSRSMVERTKNTVRSNINNKGTKPFLSTSFTGPSLTTTTTTFVNPQNSKGRKHRSFANPRLDDLLTSPSA